MGVENPLPPPPPRRRNDGGSSARQENLSNADFRRIVMETPRRLPPDENSKDQRPKKKNDDGAKRAPRKYRPPKPKEEEKINKPTKAEEDDLPKYRDRAKERREDQNPDYELMAAASGISSLHAVAPPGTIDLQEAELQKKIAIANSKYLGGDVEHTHLVKGLDYALLNKVRSEMDKKPEEEEPSEQEPRASEEPMKFNSPAARVIHKWLVNPPTMSRSNDMFLPGRMAFAFDMEETLHHIPTTVYRSKDDCPTPEDFMTVGVDSAVLERLAQIMAYLKLGTAGKASRKKKKDKGDMKTAAKEEAATVSPADAAKQADDQVKPSSPAAETESAVAVAGDEAPKPRDGEDDIFADAGTDYVVTMNESPRSEDMDESPREGNGGGGGHPSYFQDGFAQPDPDQAPVQGPAMPQFAGEWQAYPAADEVPYDYYSSQEGTASAPDAAAAMAAPVSAKDQDPRFLTQEERDRGMSSVFKRDDQRLRQRKELDAREKDPNFVSESYSECYPGYQEYNREIVDSDDEEGLAKMDVGGKSKGRLHRWDFETEEEWSKYNEQKEATPKAAYQFGVKMQDGRKTRKQNRDQKLNNELHKINQIIEKKRRDKGGGLHDDADIVTDDSSHPGKRIRT